MRGPIFQTTGGRRGLLAATGATILAAPAIAQTLSPFGGTAFKDVIEAAALLSGGRFGVAVLDTQNGRRFFHDGDERFPFASTFKCILAAAVLAAVDQGRERLDRQIPITPEGLVPYAPVTGPLVGSTMSVEALCEATMVWSDNPAANLLLPAIGGPAGLTRFARSLSDSQFRLDRTEPELNEATPGDPRDTTTPLAMLGTLNRLLIEDALSPRSRDRLIGWLIGCRTGDRKIRAGLPADWRCGDKTGSADHGTSNDIAILWPPGRRPIMVAAFITESAASAEQRDAALAALGRAIVQSIG